MKGIILCAVVFITAFQLKSQVLIGDQTTDKTTTKKPKVKKERTADGNTTVYVVTNWSNTFRMLTPNKGFYGDSLGIRADEKSLNTWSFGLGMQNKLNKFLMWDGGIAYAKNGERYSFKEADTAYSYNSYYSYIAMPIRINFTYGDRFKVYGGAGLMPQMFTGFQQDRKWTTKDGNEESETFKTKMDYSPFVISAVMNVGCMVSFNNGWGILVSPEARIQLNSTYGKQHGFIQKARCYGVTVGIIKNL